MKKFYFMQSLLAIALIAAAPLQAETKVEKAKATAEKAKKAAKERVNKSIKRLKRCIKGDCSKMEALKAARDVTVAVVALYLIGTKTLKTRQRIRRALLRRESSGYLEDTAASKAFMTVTRPVGVAAEAARTPGLMAAETAGQLGTAVQAGYRAGKRKLGY